ncbi:MAG TPA: acyl-CoA dehydrogenase C-terminal domain-containing protein [Cellvibrionaceae bacterium]|nr:acyl-CoA dehydrogenase C-terminal domain-containing protein [Cellvibrionaceae bacterium]HMW46672.1 acyl-CoA dehydrogenase C-terminal domain-containing protein [Cellvibrionaceae bacterium]HMW70225.1 acyl-CoA dehydrogenase C-terminal domain-containing protein [Cellvibrionaceae bacterium]HMY38451.1 acyl-CoA dehydrogenase C-terminal domain-containing protein [Marinagarivorans sp.]
MPHYKAPLREFDFLMAEVFKLPGFWPQLPGLGEVDWETAQEVLKQAGKWCEEVLAPLNRETDEQGCQLKDGRVTTPAGFKAAYQDYAAGGWVGLGGNPAFGGMGLPKSLVAAVEEMVQGSCMAFGLAPMLSAGACVALDAHASDAIKQLYLPKLYSGEWAGVMDLTEPQAGTDLGLLRSKALPQDDGSYAITGSKIFITWGEQDFTDNIIHLVLARLPDAPAGVKGISLFLVPKYLPDAQGGCGPKNALSCGALEKKMGIKACATCVMNFDGAKAWLIGEPHQGLACMFTMMNYERLVVGIQGLGAAHGSFIQALDYANTRLQSRSPTGIKNPAGPADPIIEHPDVRRMLLTMRALNEAGRAFYLYVAMALDGAKYAEPQEARRYADTVALLTPIAKAFITDKAFDTAVLGQQVFGGHGYIREWGQEQYVRDIRITQIYEGTNGIQAMDLLGRKILASQGQLLAPWLAEMQAFVLTTELPAALRQAFSDALARLEGATEWVLSRAKTDPAVVGNCAVAYLHLAGLVAYGYMWLRMSAAAAGREGDFYREKQQLAAFYCQHLLPQSLALHGQIIATDNPWAVGFNGVER